MSTELETRPRPAGWTWSLRDLFGLVALVAVVLGSFRQASSLLGHVIVLSGMAVFARLVLARPASAARDAVLLGGLTGTAYALLLGPITLSFNTELPLIECLAFFFTAGLLASRDPNYHDTLRTAVFWSVAGGCSAAAIIPMLNESNLRWGDHFAGLVACVLCGAAGALLAWLITSVMQREADENREHDVSLRGFGTRVGTLWLWPLVMADFSFFWMTDHRRLAVCLAVAASALAGNLVGAGMSDRAVHPKWRAGLRGAGLGAIVGTVLAVMLPPWLGVSSEAALQADEVGDRMFQPLAWLVPLAALVGWSLTAARFGESEED